MCTKKYKTWTYTNVCFRNAWFTKQLYKIDESCIPVTDMCAADRQHLNSVFAGTVVNRELISHPLQPHEQIGLVKK